MCAPNASEVVLSVKDIYSSLVSKVPSLALIAVPLPSPGSVSIKYSAAAIGVWAFKLPNKIK